MPARDTAMGQKVSKSRFKARALHYFREVERTGEDLVITDRGTPVLKLARYIENPEDRLRQLRGSVLYYEDPTEPVGVEDWEALR
jgi:antitoxin (DNA-binding transcriptional repressor) of toxin-antitoxin stability system